MADQQPVDPLAEIDSLLRTELAVEPTHEFLPRVRERIRTEPAPSRWPSLWIIAPLAAAAVIVLAIAVSLRPATPSAPVVTASRPVPLEPRVPTSALRATAGKPSPESRAPSPESRVPSPESRAPSPESRVSSTGSRVPSTGSRVPSTESRPPDAVVLIDARQRAALLTFMRLANQGGLTDESFKLTTQPPAVIEEQVKLIAVDPVAVSPIPPGGVLPSELERK